MAPAHILDYFSAKRKARFFPYFIGLCELFTTTLLILFTTSTWRKDFWFLSALDSIL